MADCAREQFSAHPKSEMKMSDYLTYWSELMKKREQQEEDEPCKLLYLKDWHLARYIELKLWSMCRNECLP